MRNVPRFKMCETCGRRPHKVAVRWAPRKDVVGYCSTCWTSPWGGDGRTLAERAHDADEAVVIYDRRRGQS